MFDKLISNIRFFSSIKSSETDLGVNYIVHKQNCENLPEFTRVLKQAGVENVRFSPMWLPDYEDYHSDNLTKFNLNLTKYVH